MRAFLTRAVIVLSAVLMTATVSAQPQGLERVGPTSQANGFPAWYQDKTGLALEFCSPLNQAELDGGWCLLLPGDTVAPEQFPNAFADEHFFFAANAIIPAGQQTDGLLVIGLEAAFANGPVVNGDQVVFARIRLRINNPPVTGTYTIYHPYGVERIDATAGQRLFFTRDIGIACVGGFDCALNGDIGPFLLASNSPGGTELPAIAGPVAGKLYIADPARLGPVTGSPLAQNYFRIVGPGGTILGETADFSLMGRVFQGTMPGKVRIDRASYSRTAASATGKTDVFAIAFPTTPTRLPGAAPAPVVQPLLDFFPAACAVNPNGTLGAPVGVTPLPMVSEGSRFYGQIQDGAIPPAVCVRDSTATDINGQVLPIFREGLVTDIVKITAAQFDPAGTGTLSVQAESSDLFAPPPLTAQLIGLLTGGAGSVPMTAPPSKVFVTSQNGGRAEAEVTTIAGPLTPSTRPFAGNDTALVDEDSPANQIAVLANDTINGVPITAADNPVVTIVGAPRLGVAVVNLAGEIEYTPNANAFGSDLVTYIVTVGTSTSSPAFVSITIRNVNDAPVAVDDVSDGTTGVALSINLLANDSDLDGAADLTAAVIVTGPADPSVIWSVTGGLLTLTGPAGVHTFTYQARDAAGALSNIANVSVTLVSTETLTITRVEYIQSKRRWRVDGTTDVLTDHSVFVSYADGTFADGTPAAGTLVGTAQAVAGLWVLDLTLAGANDPRNPTSTLFSVRPTAVYASTPGGLSAPRAIGLK